MSAPVVEGRRPDPRRGVPARAAAGAASSQTAAATAPAGAAASRNEAVASHDGTAAQTGAATSRVLADAAAQVVAAVARLSGLVNGAGAWPVADRRTVLRLVDDATATLGVARARVLAAEVEGGEWALAGDRSVLAWRARQSGAGFAVAGRELRQATAVTVLPGAATAVADGRMSAAHLDELARVIDRAGDAVREVLADPQTQQHLVETARRQDAPTFGRTVARMAAALDPRGLEDLHQAQRRARFLHLADTVDGTRLTGLLDTMSGHRLRLALDALTGIPAADDERDPGQRRADALTGLADHALADPAVAPGTVVPAQVTILMTPEAWAGLRGAARATDRRTGGAEPELTGVTPARLPDGTPVPTSELARSLCDCTLSRLVVDAAGRPLDVGRDARLFTRSQRRAILARDGGCGWPGCTMPARYCEFHHVRWWDRDGGRTDVDNGIALCSHHHHRVHEADLRITRVPAVGADARGAPVPSPGAVTTSAANGVGLVEYRVTRPGGEPLAGWPRSGPDG